MKNVKEMVNVDYEAMVLGYQAMAAINLEEVTAWEDSLNDGEYE